MLHVLLPPPHESMADDALIVDAVLHATTVRPPFLSFCDYAIGVRSRKIVTVRKILTARPDMPLQRRSVSIDPTLRPKKTGVLLTLGEADSELVDLLIGQDDPLAEPGFLTVVRIVEVAKIVQGVRVRLGGAAR